MKRTFFAAILVALASVWAFARQGAQAAGSASAAAPASQGQAGASAGAGMAANANAAPGTVTLAAGATIDAELTKSVDAKKAKSGDQVTARVRNDVKQGGNVVIRKGSKLVGHVTEAKARAKGQENSELGIIFDRAEIKGGQSIAFMGAIQALAPPVQTPTMGGNEQTGPGADMGRGPVGSGGSNAGGGMAGGNMGGAAGGAMGGAVGGVGRDVGGAVGGAGEAAGQTAGTAGRTAGRAGADVSGSLNGANRGVLGLPGLQISNELSNSTNGTVLVSNSKDVHLDSGTQMVLRVVSQ